MSEIPEYKVWKEQARGLAIEELRRHARVADLEGFPHCRQCFCCACWDVLFERQKQRDEELAKARKEEFEARYAKVQAEKEAARSGLTESGSDATLLP